jgi:hypothetical protein
MSDLLEVQVSEASPNNNNTICLICLVSVSSEQKQLMAMYQAAILSHQLYVKHGCHQEEFMYLPFEEMSDTLRAECGMDSDWEPPRSVRALGLGGKKGTKQQWGETTPLNEWEGVSTNETGNVIALNLPAAFSVRCNFEIDANETFSINGIVFGDYAGQFPSEICALEFLVDLTVRDCSFRALPDAIQNLVNLQKLDFSGNHLVSLPDAIGELQGLTHLNVSDQGHEDWGGVYGAQWVLHFPLNGLFPEVLCKLTRLEELIMNKTIVTAIPASINKLTNLRRLDLSNLSSNLSPLPNMAGCTALTDLDLSRFSYRGGYGCMFKKEGLDEFFAHKPPSCHVWFKQGPENGYNAPRASSEYFVLDGARDEDGVYAASAPPAEVLREKLEFELLKFEPSLSSHLDYSRF